jgi:pyruvate/2-oxoglutarate dehydrogenase complex dihydrolipoamide dehydrogenase (E3) component
MADLLRLYSGKSWYPKFDLENISMAKALKTYRDVGQKAMAEFMVFQTTKQLKIDVVWGEGLIIDKNTVKVDGKKYSGKALVIGTGSRPTIPEIPGVNLKGVMTYIDHPEIRKDPKRLVVIGGGKIGMGKAAMFRAFGVDVTVLEKYACLPNWDKDVREFIFRNLALRKMKIHEGVEVKEIRGKGRVESVVAEVNGKKKVFPCDAVMLSIGLTPNSEIAHTLGVKIGAKNEIVVDEGMRTSLPGVYAVGDVVGPPYFMAIARKSGMVAAKNISGRDAKLDLTFVPEHVYLPPLEATYVGLTEEEARKQYKNVVVMKAPVGERPKNAKPEQFTPGYPGSVLPICGRMHTINWLYYGRNMQGMLKAVIDADSRKYLGFHHVGDGAKVSFQYLSHFLKTGFTVDQMAEQNEIFLNAEHFIQLTRLIGGYEQLIDLC